MSLFASDQLHERLVGDRGHPLAAVDQTAVQGFHPIAEFGPISTKSMHNAGTALSSVLLRKNVMQGLNSCLVFPDHARVAPLRDEATPHVGDIVFETPPMTRLGAMERLPLIHGRDLALPRLSAHLDARGGPASHEPPQRPAIFVEVGVVATNGKYQRRSPGQVRQLRAVVEAGAADVILARVFENVLGGCAVFAPGRSTFVQLVTDCLELALANLGYLVRHAGIVRMLLKGCLADMFCHGKTGDRGRQCT